MSEERHITVQVENNVSAFNGTTVINVDPARWRDARTGNAKYLYTEQQRIGRFTPYSLGRPPYTHSIVKVYCDGPVADGDGVFVLGSRLLSDDVAPIDPLRTATVPLTTSIEDAKAFELGPTDDICVVFAGDGELATLHFVVYDLDEAGLDRRDNTQLLGEVISGGGSSATGQITFETVLAAKTLDPWSGLKYVFVNVPAAAVIRLPAVASVPVPGPNGPVNRLIFIRTGGGPPIIEAQNGERINGQLSPAFAFEIEGFKAIQVDRVGTGYTATQPLITVPVQLTNAVVGGTVNIPVPPSNVCVTQLDFSADGDAVLPDTVLWPFDSEMFIMRAPGLSGGSQVRIVPPAGQLLNSEVDGHAFLAPGKVGRLHRTLTGYAFMDDGQSRETSLIALAGANVAIDPWGLAAITVDLNGAGAQTLTLPPRARVPRGAPVYVYSRNAAKTVSAAAGETIAGGGGAPALTFNTGSNTVRLFIAAGTTQWMVM